MLAFERHSSYRPQHALWLVHGGVIRIVLASLLQIDLEHSQWLQQLSVPYGSVSRISRYNAQSPWQIQCIAAPGL
jgi:broad specificity phosphatase PhoE